MNKFTKFARFVVLFLLSSMLIIAFAFWGIGDMIRSGGRSAEVAHVGGLRTTIAICFEAGLMWPLLASQLAQPEAYIAVGNLSWGRTTNLNRQGRAAAAAWARLAGLPAVIAINN